HCSTQRTSIRRRRPTATDGIWPAPTRWRQSRYGKPVAAANFGMVINLVIIYSELAGAAGPTDERGSLRPRLLGAVSCDFRRSAQSLLYASAGTYCRGG